MIGTADTHHNSNGRIGYKVAWKYVFGNYVQLRSLQHFPTFSSSEVSSIKSYVFNDKIHFSASAA